MTSDGYSPAGRKRSGKSDGKCRLPVQCPRWGCDGSCPAHRVLEGFARGGEPAFCKACYSPFSSQRAKQILAAWTKDGQPRQPSAQEPSGAKPKRTKRSKPPLDDTASQLRALQAEVKELRSGKAQAEAEPQADGAAAMVVDSGPAALVKAALCEKKRLEAVPTDCRCLFNWEEQLSACKQKLAAAQADERGARPLPDRQAQSQRFLLSVQASHKKAVEGAGELHEQLAALTIKVAAADAEAAALAEKVGHAKLEVASIMALAATQATGVPPPVAAPALQETEITLIQNLLALIPEEAVAQAAGASGTSSQVVGGAAMDILGRLRSHLAGQSPPPQVQAPAAAAADATSLEAMREELRKEMLESIISALPDEALDEGAKILFKERFVASAEAKRQKTQATA